MIQPDFTSAENTVILSDIHLANLEPPHPKNPLWKCFKDSKHFIDDDFSSFLSWIVHEVPAPVELVLNGDIFDFDSVMSLPDANCLEDLKLDPMQISWLERMRGLSSEEPKSRFKMKEILDAHPVWVQALQEWIQSGNRIVFIMGNHDLELHWPGVQQDLFDRLQPTGPTPHSSRQAVRFCEWFYLSNRDTLIEHGNQYDAYCLCSNPIHPLIDKSGKALVRLPFGNLAGKYMINGMGLMNPHASESFIKSSTWEYVCFYFKYMMRTQPLLLWTWFWSAFATLFCSLREGFLPAMRDPLTVDARIQDIAHRANASVFMVLALKEVHVHPAIFNPIKILRELWLDRAILLVLILLGSFQFFSFLNVFTNVSFLWFVIPLILLVPGFIFYARSVQSEVNATQEAAAHLSPTSARITQVKRIVHGHTHHELHTWTEEGLELLNTGTWSPAFHDVECTQPFGRKCFAWIRSTPGQKGKSHPHRIAELYEWNGGKARLLFPASADSVKSSGSKDSRELTIPGKVSESKAKVSRSLGVEV